MLAAMRLQDADTFTLDTFEGPLDFLLHLIQKNEIDIYGISLQQVMEQYLAKLKKLATLDVDNGAEFIGAAASLILIKSRTLLPKHEQQEQFADEEPDPRFEIIHHLLDYCRFKEAAKALVEREEQQCAFFERGMDDLKEQKKPLGIEHLSLSDLAALFQQVLAKAVSQSGIIHEETWRVSDMLALVRKLLVELPSIRFVTLFSAEKSREELIVTFLAILELMKLEEICVVHDRVANDVIILGKKR